MKYTLPNLKSQYLPTNESRIRFFFETIDNSTLDTVFTYGGAVTNWKYTTLLKITELLTFTHIQHFVDKPTNVPYKQNLNNVFIELYSKYLEVFKCIIAIIRKNGTSLDEKLIGLENENLVKEKIQEMEIVYCKLLQMINDFMINSKVAETEAEVAKGKLDGERIEIFEFKDGKTFFLGKVIEPKHQDTSYINVLNFILVNYKNKAEFSFKEFAKEYKKKDKIIDRKTFTELLMNKNRSLLRRLKTEFKEEYRNIPHKVFKFKNKGSDLVQFNNNLQ